MNALTSRLQQLGSLTSSFNYERLSTDSGALRTRFANIKTVGDFFDIKRMSKPSGFGEAQSRVQFNLGYFSTNYAIVFALLSVYSLLTNIRLLFVLIFLVGGLFGIGSLQGRDLVTPFGTIANSSLYTALFIISIPWIMIASPLSTILWLIGASGVSILGHAAFMEKPIESAFAEEQV